MISPVHKLLNRPEELGVHASELFRSWLQSAESNYHKKWLYLLRLYWGYMPRNPVDEFRSRVVLPLVYTAIDVELPRHIRAVYSLTPPISATPRNGDVEAEVKAEMVENIIAYYWSRDGRREAQSGLSFLDSMLWGVGFEKGSWMYEESLTGVPRIDEPQWNRVSPMELVWRPDARDFADTPLIHWRVMRHSELVALNDAGAKLQNLDKLEKYDRSFHGKQYTLDDVYRSIGLNGPLYRSNENLEAEEDPFHIIGEWCDDDIQFMFEANSGVIVMKPRLNRLGEKNYAWYVHKRHGDLAVGKSLAETLAPINESLNVYERAYQENMVASTHRMILFNPSYGVSKEDLAYAPNKIVPVKGLGDAPLDRAVMEMNIQPPHQGGRDVQDRLMQWYERAAGQSAMQQGATVPRAETYGATIAQGMEAQIRSYIENRNWGAMVARSARLTWLMCRQYMDEVVSLPMTGRRAPREVVQNYADVTSTNMDGSPVVGVTKSVLLSMDPNAFDFQCTGSDGLANREYAASQLMALNERISADPIIGLQPAQVQNPQQIDLFEEMLLQAIGTSEVAGKGKMVRMVRAAYATHRQTMQAPPPAPDPNAQPPPPGGGQPQDMALPPVPMSDPNALAAAELDVPPPVPPAPEGYPDPMAAQAQIAPMAMQ